MAQPYAAMHSRAACCTVVHSHAASVHSLAPCLFNRAKQAWYPQLASPRLSTFTTESLSGLLREACLFRLNALRCCKTRRCLASTLLSRVHKLSRHILWLTTRCRLRTCTRLPPFD